MSKARLYLLPLAAAYTGVFWLVYVRFINPLFGYMHYDLIDRPLYQDLVTFVIAVLPVLFAPVSKSVASVLVSFVYVIYYMSAVMVPHFALHRGFDEVLALQLALAAGMCMLFIAARGVPADGELLPISKRHANAILILSILMILLVAVVYRSTMQIVSFVDVYDVRSRSHDVEAGALTGYVVMWLTNCLLPFSLARGVINKEKVHLIVAVAGCIIVYAAQGAKGAALMPFMIIATYVLLKWRGPFLRNLMLAACGFFLFLIFCVPDQEPGRLMKSILFERTLGTTGGMIVAYYTVFTKLGLTYLSHVGVVQALTGWYPYKEGLGEVICQVYFVCRNGNFNAGFWATDGIAGFGIVGIYLISVLVAAYCRILFVAASRFDPVFMGAWATGFAGSLLNVSFFTSLLSSGGLLILAMIYFFRKPLVFGGEHVTGPPDGAEYVDPAGV